MASSAVGADRTLETLLWKESEYLPATENYLSAALTDVEPSMRKDLLDWMLEVCRDRNRSRFHQSPFRPTKFSGTRFTYYLIVDKASSISYRHKFV
jgi:hypothetical protein